MVGVVCGLCGKEFPGHHELAEHQVMIHGVSAYPEVPREDWRRDIVGWMKRGRLEKVCWEMMYHYPDVTFGEVLEYLQKIGAL